MTRPQARRENRKQMRNIVRRYRAKRKWARALRVGAEVIAHEGPPTRILRLFDRHRGIFHMAEVENKLIVNTIWGLEPA